MTWADLFHTGWDAIRTHKLRSMLTSLGILIGIAAVVLTVGLGQGAQQKVSKQLAALGGNLLIVTPGSSTSGGVRGGLGSASTLTLADATALTSKTAAPDVGGVAPVLQRSESLVNGSTNWTTTVVGTTASWLPVRGRTLASGRFISAADESSGAAVTVLASDTAAELFGPLDPVGQSVTINGVPYQVIGVLTSAGSDSTTNLDDQAILPLSTASQRLVGGTDRTSVGTIYVKAVSDGRLSAAYQETNAILGYRHAITSSSTSDFTITTQQSLISTTSSVDKTLTNLLIGIAALSLLVGGIGVMNIMLVSVTERTREIGLRIAVGARGIDILRQFLVESATLSLAGGIIGIACGIASTYAIAYFAGWRTPISLEAVAVSFLFAGFVGVFAGLYPALKAAALNPIEALRYE